MAPTERQYPRFAHEATVEFRFGEQTTTGRTRNLSRGGLCATVADPIPTGSDVDVGITLLFDDQSQSEPLHMIARVVWCTELEDAYQIGVSFRQIDAKRAEYLTMFLKYLSDESSDEPAAPPSVDDRFG